MLLEWFGQASTRGSRLTGTGITWGLRRQVEDCERLVALRGWEVAERYVDDDVSAYRGRPRPEYRRMLDDLRSGFVEAVVVWDADRLHRQPKELEEFFDVCKAAGVTQAGVGERGYGLVDG